MARKKTTNTSENQDSLFRVTSLTHDAVFLPQKIIAFDSNHQALVTKSEMELLKKMGVIV